MSLAKRFKAAIAGRGVTFKRFVVTGGAAAAALTCTGLKKGDQFIFCAEFDNSVAADGAALLEDRTGEASIPAAGQIAFSTTNTTGSKILVSWLTLA